MRNRSAVAAIVLAGSFLAPRAADADANKEHQQIMAELRMLQEQQSQLLRGIEGLNEQLRLITTKIDDQTGTTRKAFADQKLLIDGVAESQPDPPRESGRHQRAPVDDDAGDAVAAPDDCVDAGAGSCATGRDGRSGRVDPAAPATPTAPVAPPPNISPTQMFDRVSADYAAGQYDLAIEGFQAFIRTFPTSPQADDAQLYIGNSLSVRREVQGSAAGLPEVDHRLSRRLTRCPTPGSRPARPTRTCSRPTWRAKPTTHCSNSSPP